MDVINTDWLHQQELDEWRRSIWQLHRELSEQRMQPQKSQSIPQGVAEQDPDQSACACTTFEKQQTLRLITVV